MKKTTQLTITFVLLFLNTLTLKADNCNPKTCFALAQCLSDTVTEPHTQSWEKPKAAENLKTRIESKIKELTKQKAENQAKQDDPNAHLTEKQKVKITSAIKDLDSRLAELHISKADMERLEKDTNHIYSFSDIGDNGVTKSSENEVVIHGANEALLIHEIRHISLWLQVHKNLRFNKYDLLLAISEGGFLDEMQGYRAQYAFDPQSFPRLHLTAIEQINMEFISKIERENGSFAYPSVRKMWQNQLKMAELETKFKQSTEGAISTTISH
jgi:hypothetical protein